MFYFKTCNQGKANIFGGNNLNTNLLQKNHIEFEQFNFVFNVYERTKSFLIVILTYVIITNLEEFGE
jgi:hypothetical protein